jgi:hypothetical protein
VITAPGRQARTADAEALFEQARRRRRRRRQVGAVVISLMMAGAAAAGLAIGGGHHDAAARAGDEGRPTSTATARAARFTLPAVRLAWVDSGGYLNVGDLATGAQHAGPVIDASESAALVSVGGQVYWPDSNRNVAPIRDYDLAAGKIRYLPGGESVFAAGDGRHVYIVRNGSTLIELRADGSGTPAVLRVPAGWYVSGHAYQWFPWEGTVAGGILVYSTNEPDYLPDSAWEGVWNPRTGQVRVLGQGYLIESAYTPPGARYSLIVWIPPSREVARDFHFRITNTSTLATVTVRSPLHHGFAVSGALAFSPGGSDVAVFARTSPLGGLSKLAIASTRTGAVRLVNTPAFATTEDSFWALWLPRGQVLLAGAATSGYAVDTRTLAAIPFSDFPGMDGYSAIALPARRSQP